MKHTLKKLLENLKPKFTKGGKLEKFYPVFEAHETLLFQPDEITKRKGAHIRDANDMKRLMTTVIAALVPCILFGVWNIGHQHYLSLASATTVVDGNIVQDLSLLRSELGDPFATLESVGFFSKVLYGLWPFILLLAVSYAVGLGIEFTFAVVRKHPVSEGFLVSGLLIPLCIPPTTPLWQVAIATAFAVVIGKEVFGGTGFNFLNPALTARAFLFFAYPAQLSGNGPIWIDMGDFAKIDGVSGATPLELGAQAKYVFPETMGDGDVAYGFWDMFFGWIPGSVGETSALACLIGAVLLIATGVGSWRIMISMVIGGLGMAYLVEASGVNFFGVDNFYWHIVAGGFAFGTVFMATDPVSAAHTNTGKYIYGFLAGAMAILIRVVNPAYPEGVMLAILLLNVFAPLIDHYVISANKKRRLKRATV